jgi:hypothetical protein
LADGYSVEAIVSERAIGFSETGMFGIRLHQGNEQSAYPDPRVADLQRGIGDAMTKSVAAPKTGPDELAHRVETDGKPFGVDVATFAAARTGLLRNDRDQINVPQMAGSVADGDVRAQQVAKAVDGESEQHLFRASLHSAFLSRAAGQNRRELSLYLDIDDGTNMSIYVTSSAVLPHDQIFREFVDLSRQFGVTLNNVMLNRSTINFPYSNR